MGEAKDTFENQFSCYLPPPSPNHDPLTWPISATVSLAGCSSINSGATGRQSVHSRQSQAINECSLFCRQFCCSCWHRFMYTPKGKDLQLTTPNPLCWLKDRRVSWGKNGASCSVHLEVTFFGHQFWCRLDTLLWPCHTNFTKCWHHGNDMPKSC